MKSDAHLPIEEMEVFLRFSELADWAWNAAVKWQPFARDTVGKQFVRAIDSVGANLVEGDGRYGTPDGLHFFVIARASAREARYWLGRASQRGLVEDDVASRKIEELIVATRMLNSLIAYRRTARDVKATVVRDPAANYPSNGADPFLPTDADLPNT